MSAAAHQSYALLRPYQQQLADLLAGSTAKDEIVPLQPGFGRRPITVAAAESIPVANPRILVVAAKVICQHWVDEWDKWGTMEARVVQEPEDGVVNVTPLSTFSCARGPSFLHPWDLLIVDQPMGLKKSSSRRTRVLNQVRKQSGRNWLLTIPFVRNGSLPQLGQIGSLAAGIDYDTIFGELSLLWRPFGPLVQPGPLLRPSALAERALYA